MGLGGCRLINDPQRGKEREREGGGGGGGGGGRGPLVVALVNIAFYGAWRM